MGKKYVIELEEIIVNTADGQMPLYRIKGFNAPVFDSTGVSKLTPYKVRKESCDKCMNEVEDLAYQLYSLKVDEAYQRGLNNAWKCVKKIESLSTHEFNKVFTGYDDYFKVFENYTPQEAIEKIRQYEQKQEEEIKVGNEVKGGNEKYIVLQKYVNNIDKQLMIVLFNRRDGQIGTWHMYNANGAIFEKTGRHFPEIVEMLKKMQEEKK
jgi:hypothetical protein